MVKNTKGGSGHKSLARKNAVSSSSSSLRLPQHELECFASITKLYGNGMCLVNASFHDQIIPILCHIRGKFRSRNKNNNTVSHDSIILIGLRDWELPNLKNSDLLFVFDQNDIRSLLDSPSRDTILSLSSNYSSSLSSSSIDFISSHSEPSFDPSSHNLYSNHLSTSSTSSPSSLADQLDLFNDI
jgi:hypothetical protein